MQKKWLELSKSEYKRKIDHQTIQKLQHSIDSNTEQNHAEIIHYCFFCIFFIIFVVAVFIIYKIRQKNKNALKLYT